MKCIKRVVVLSCALLIASCGQKDPSTYINAGDQFFKAKDYTASIVEYKNAVEINPDSGEYRFKLGNAYLRAGNYLEANKELLKARLLKFESEALYVGLARSYYYSLQYGSVIDLVSDVSLTNAELESEKLFFLGMAHLATLNTKDAEGIFNSATSELSNTLYAKLIQAHHLVLNNKFGQSRDILLELIQQKPELAESYVLLGQVENALGQYESAIPYWQQYKKLHPNDPKTSLLIATAQLKLGNYAEADKLADDILRRRSSSPYGHQIKAVAQFKLGNYEAAKRSILLALQYGLRTQPNLLLAGISSYLTGSYEQAHKYLQPLSEDVSADHPIAKLYLATRLALGYEVDLEDKDIDALSEEDFKLLASTGYALLKSGDEAQVKKVVKNLAVVDDKGSKELAQLGILKLSVNDLSGIEDLNAALAGAENKRPIKYALVSALIHSNQLDEAQVLANKWIKNNPNEVDGYNLSAIAFLKAGNREQAEQRYKEALEVKQDNINSLFYFAIAAFREREYEKASALLEDVLDANQVYMPALSLWYTSSKQIGKEERVIKRLEKLSTERNDIYIDILLARIYLNLGQADQAISRLSKHQNSAVKKPEEFWRFSTAALKFKAKYPEALTVNKQWVEEHPDSERAFLELIDSFEVNGQVPAALSAVDHLLVLNNSDNYKLIKAHLHIINRDFDAAEKILNGVDNKYQSSPLGLGVSGQIDLKDGKFQSATRKLLEYYKLKPNSRSATLVFLAYSGAKKEQDAIAFLSKHLETYHWDQAGRKLYADFLLQHDKIEATKQYKILVEEFNNKNVVVLNNLSHLLLEQMKFKQADRYISQAVKLAPRAPLVLDTAGLIKLELNDVRAAIDLFNKALSIQDLAEIRQHLVRAEKKLEDQN